jgi:hypothetical protein
MYNALTSRLPNQISSERANLLVQIAKCHRLAKEVDDQETVNKLLPLAAEYEQKLNHQPGPQATTNPASNSLGADANKVEGIPALVRHLQRPLVARLELTINVLEQFAGHAGGLKPCGFVVRQLFADHIGVRTLVVDVEKVSSHPRKRRTLK